MAWRVAKTGQAARACARHHDQDLLHRRTGGQPDRRKTEGRLPQDSLTTDPHHLAGRTLTGSLRFMTCTCRTKEVILSFDDGPIPGRSGPRARDTGPVRGVKGAFMMVGEMAELHPELARKRSPWGRQRDRQPHLSARQTWRRWPSDMAMKEITRGGGSRHQGDRCRRQPLCAFHTLPTATSFAPPCNARHGRDGCGCGQQGLPQHNRLDRPTTKRTIETCCTRRGRGIILMHDIHNRTATMGCRRFFQQLEAEGYKVVTLQFKPDSTPPRWRLSDWAPSTACPPVSFC